MLVRIYISLAISILLIYVMVNITKKDANLSSLPPMIAIPR